jgi:glycosyltransferase involved in cell wall biosynthesis
MIHGAMLVRNEQGRYLEKVLEQMVKVCDRIVFIDDASTDDTEYICIRYGVQCKDGFRLRYSEESLWGINELKQRKRLWELATEGAAFGDWILCLDADETFDKPELVKSYIPQAEAAGCNSLAFRLYDMWDETHFRDDYYWQAHNGVWPFCVKHEDLDYFWKETPLHCGRFPMNAGNKIAMCPVRIQHWGWSRPEDRREKYDRYMRADPEGESGCLGQYQSILDPNPTLRRFE